MSRFGYAPEPLPDEPLDHWLAKVAADAGVSVNVLLGHHGLADATDKNPARGFTAEQVNWVADLAGIDPARFVLMTTRRWAHLGINADMRSQSSKGASWSATTVQRTCSVCLTEREGTPRIHWRLLWSFACTRHQRFLDPLDAAGPVISVPDTALEVQATIDDLLAGQITSIDALGRAVPGWAYLADLGALARCAITTPTTRQLSTWLEEATGESWTQLAATFPPRPATATPPARLAAAANSPTLTSAAIVLADDTLRQTNTGDASHALNWMSESARNELRDHAAQRGITYPLWEALAANKRTQSRAAYLKRFALTRRNQTGQLLPPLTSASVPARIWTTVLTETVDQPVELQAFTISAALLMIASNRRTNEALELLGLSHLRQQIQRDWAHALGTGPAATAIHEHLLRLHQTLATGHVPINYDRRRRTFPYPEPLGTQHRNQLLRALDQPGQGHLATHAAWYIHELLTGSDFLISEQGLNLPGPHRQQYRRRRTTWNSTQPQILFELAERRLYRHNINEPVTWSPRHENGRWITPPDDGHRHLADWTVTNRPLRAEGLPSPRACNGFGLDAAVAHALHGSGPSADRVRRLLARFEVLVAAGNYNAAAATLGISQSALSVAMQDLERHVAKPLFDRSKRHMTLHPSGHALLRLIRTEANR